MTSSLPPLIQACSGALASASANAISYPLDLVATKVQTTTDLQGALRILKHILRTRGVSGLYEGLATDTASTVLSNFLYFYFDTVLHALATRRHARHNTPVIAALRQALTAPTRSVLLSVPTEIVIGFLAGVASRAISTPLSVLTVQLQTSNNEDAQLEEREVQLAHSDTVQEKATRKAGRLVELAKEIYAEHGLPGFWAGFAPTLPLALTPALTLLFYQLLRRIRLPVLSSPACAALRAFMDGACANALALALLYPLVLAKVRVQARRRPTAEGGAPTMASVWRAALSERGWSGLYDGLGAQLMKGFVSQGVTMMAKQR
ncbi:hypothetical protein POSPLADRAFT_1145290 [Postia placenta MAD-698-R-SB12]|uniref:Mitochondrial carrier n=1 Tax=Postia placenta MAD-698-R-SB12 TaxID=670580 RepID=A0A1X6MZ85_9APHY|nr:hypothetical protein POSPLADRAFT_1145290 [Postia placenta MAD-698-R-SB12]OSX61684.1 hypothetical protein POSPLADRAFT_1145290 [Postia placenta MAD-698-R-SB12]